MHKNMLIPTMMNLKLQTHYKEHISTKNRSEELIWDQKVLRDGGKNSI